MLNESEIIAALRDCYDPELPCNVVDLGLVRAVTMSPDNEAPGAGIPGVPQKYFVHIDLILTHPSEEAEAQLRAQIANRLAGLEAVGQTTITVHAESTWSPANITPAGRKTLGLDGNPQLVQIR